MTAENRPTPAEAREQALVAMGVAAQKAHEASAGIPSLLQEDLWKVARRAIERAQEAAVREALYAVPCCDEETGEEGWIRCGEKYDGAISLCARCERNAAAEARLDALAEEVKDGDDR